MPLASRSLFALVAALAVALSLLATASPAAAAETIAYTGNFGPGTIIVQTSERRLYLVLDGGRALRYTVGVGRAGRQWSGVSFIDGKYIRPNWSPPADVRRAQPKLPNVIPSGSAANPMGAAAMTLSGSEYAIHGTNAPGSIGGFVSYGCIRMFNQDIADLYSRVRVGTPVVVLR